MSFLIDFDAAMEAAYYDWKNFGKCLEADYYNNGIKLDKNKFDDCFPHFFTGERSSEFVMVQLNPRRIRNGKVEDFNCYHLKIDDISDEEKRKNFESYEKYIQYFTEFGKRQYLDNEEYCSTFDKKQLLFLLPFKDFFDFTKEDERKNLASSIDKKLQIELVPFGSPDFDTNRIMRECDLSKPIERILKFIAKYDRKYIIFCSRGFEDIFNRNPQFLYKKLGSKKFKLIKKDGSETKSEYELIKIVLKVDEKKINAVIAPQYADQNLNGDIRTQYGKRIKDAFDEIVEN